MLETLIETLQLLGEWIADAAPLLLTVGVCLAPWVLPLLVLLVAARVFIVLPLRRREWAHLFLDLLEMGAKQGRSPESLIVEVASTADKMLGRGFARLADRVRAGDSLGRALAKLPGLLPEPLTAMLQAGEQARDIRKVLAPGRAALAAGPSRTMGAFHYLPVFWAGPPMLAVAQFLLIVIIPKFNEIYRDLLEGLALPGSTRLLFASAPYFWPLGVALLLVLCFGLSLVFERGQRFWFSVYLRRFKALGDRVLFRLPWRRKRMQRDFSAMLALLLDAGMPEADAVSLAAQSTANSVFIARAQTVVERLRQGVKLTEAIRVFDDTGEFHWRLVNAAHAGSGFLRALEGWHDALDAKAFQQEQAASQAISTALIVLNGALVCWIALAIFQPMVKVVQEGAMW
jgi:type II secretory pathway component PulF